MRFIDPDGMGPNDIIRFMNNGSVQRTKTDDNFDLLTDESGDKTKKIDHKDGESQIGDIKTAKKGDDTIQFMLISDNEVATDVFEFAASTTANETSNAEFGLDVFNFADGFSMNLVQTGQLSPLKLPSVFPLGNAGNIDLGNDHFIRDSNWIENNHSHPGNFTPLTPSGFRRGFQNGSPYFEAVGGDGAIGDRTSATGKGRNANEAYLYSPHENTYIKYDSKSAKIIGNRK